MKSASLVKLIALGGVVAAFVAVMFLMGGPRPRGAEATANPLPPLIACPNLDASTETGGPPGTLGKVSVVDILTVVSHYGKSYGQSGYEYLWDSVSPYNSTSPNGTGSITVADILYVVTHYGNTCPLLDTQIATTTRAIGDPTFSSTLCDPALTTAMNCGGDPQFLTENASFLHTKHYYEASSPVPGQGVHYINMDLYDGVFNPARPEGLVYKQGGALLATLYVTDGGAVGWGTHEATSCCPGAEHDIDLEGAADGPQCSPECSWAGSEGWHVHHYLCTVHIGTSSAFAISAALAPSVADTQAHCQSYSGGEPLCTIPVTTTPCYQWSRNVGWMGHLWNWLPNANLVPDSGGPDNGRFADCFPDTAGWTAYNCPG